MKKTLVVLGTLLLAGVATAGPSAAPIDQVRADWQPMTGDPKGGPWLSIVQGDPDAGPYTMLLKLKAGFESPWHSHDAAYSAVVIQGVATHQDEGGALVKAKVGQAYTSAGGVTHRNTCLGKTDCVVFVASSGPRSFHMPKQK